MLLVSNISFTRSFFISFSFILSIFLNAQDVPAKTFQSGLKIWIDKRGKGYNAHAGQKIKVHYKLYSPKDSLVESSYDMGSAISFKLGVGEVIPGWDSAFVHLNKGCEARLFIPSHLAYGERGVEDPYFPDEWYIKPNSDLWYEIKVVKIK